MSNISRRNFLKTTLGMGAAAVATGMLKAKNKKTSSSPNILFCIADDWTWIHSGIEGCDAVDTPNFDKVAQKGVYFKNAYCSAPSCAPSRASILAGRNGWELEEGAVLWGQFPAKYKVYPEILEEHGYHVGYTGKGWAPGDIEDSGRTRNPAGKEYNEIRQRPWTEFGVTDEMFDVDYAANFATFLKDRKNDQPFCFWLGTIEPHRAYAEGLGKRRGKDPQAVELPDFLPDTPRVRSDILDYLSEIEWVDIQLGRVLDTLERKGELDNTLIVVTSDNGMPFPRAKANLYEYGTHMPLAICWGNEIKGGRKVDDFVSFIDFAPTFLEAAGIEVPEEMSGQSLMPQLLSERSGQIDPQRNVTFTYKERHAWSNPGGLATPMRSIRKDNFLLIWNIRPERWPAGHELPEFNWDMWPFGDVDHGPAKEEVLACKYDEKHRKYYDWAFSKRPEFELYDIAADPYQLNNLAKNPKYKKQRESLFKNLKQYLTETGDLRMQGRGEVYERTPYYCTQGLETGGLWLKEFQELNLKEREKAYNNARKQLRVNLKKLREITGRPE